MKRLGSLLTFALLGCGRHELELLVPSDSPDPCLELVTEQECDENAALGCSFQPNDPGCRSDEPDCRPGLCRSGDPFVRRVERSFLLNGEHFRFAGVGSWALMQPSPCLVVRGEEREAWLERAFDELVPARAKVARFYAFQTSAGPNGDDFSYFDVAVRHARRAGVRLVFVLEHGNGECSEGGHRGASWYETGYLDPDGAYKRAYRDYARSVAERYRQEPTVLGYVLVQGLGAGVETERVASFVEDMGQLLHGSAPSQLLSLDLDWADRAAMPSNDFGQLQELAAVDYVDVDDYVFSDQPQPMDPGMLEVLASIDKPAVIGEGAFMLEEADETALARRGEQVKRRMALWYEAGFAGALLWAYQPGWKAISEEFDARPGDPLLPAGGVLAGAPW